MLFMTFFNGCVHEGKTTGFWQEMHSATPVNTGIQRNGSQIYHYKCHECHDRNTQGAPMPGDTYDWNVRYQKGLQALVQHSIDGFNRGLMPSRGGCRNCSDQELNNAIIYMLKKAASISLIIK